MNPAVIKLGFFALDQIAKWVTVAIKAKANPNMTDTEVDQLVLETQVDTIKLSDDWRTYRSSGQVPSSPR